MAQHPLIIEATRSHSDTPHSVGILWKVHQPDEETATWRRTPLTRDRHPCPRWTPNPQTHDLDRAATGMGTILTNIIILGTRSQR